MKITRADYEYWKVKKMPEPPAFFDKTASRKTQRSGRDLIDGVINARGDIRITSEPHNTMAILTLKMKRQTATEALSTGWIDDHSPKRNSLLRKWRKKLGIKL